MNLDDTSTICCFCNGSKFNGGNNCKLVKDVLQRLSDDDNIVKCILCTCGKCKIDDAAILLVLPVLSVEELQLLKKCFEEEDFLSEFTFSNIDFMTVRRSLDYLMAGKRVMSILKQIIVDVTDIYQSNTICVMSGFAAFPSIVDKIHYEKYARNAVITDFNSTFNEQERVKFAMATGGENIMLYRQAPTRINMVEQLSLPEGLIDMVHESSSCVIAGGAVMAIARGVPLKASSDIDIFIFNVLSAQQIIENIENMVTILENNGYVICKNILTNSVITAIGKYGTRPIQIILADACDGDDLIAKYDLYCSQVFYDGKYLHYTAAAADAWSSNIVIGGPGMFTIESRRLIKMTVRDFTLSTDVKEYLDTVMTATKIDEARNEILFGQAFMMNENVPREQLDHILLKSFGLKIMKHDKLSVVKFGSKNVKKPEQVIINMNDSGWRDSGREDGVVSLLEFVNEGSDSYGRKRDHIIINMKELGWAERAVDEMELRVINPIHKIVSNSVYTLHFGHSIFTRFTDNYKNVMKLVDELDIMQFGKYMSLIESKFDLEMVDESKKDVVPVWVDKNTVWLKHGIPNPKKTLIGYELEISSILLVPRTVTVGKSLKMAFTAVVCMLN